MSVKSGKTRNSTGTQSILKKTSSLKKRLSEIVQKPVKVRFQLPHSKRVQSILEEYVKTKQSKEYLSLICLIRDAELLDTDVSSLLSEATQCISLLNQDLRLFVEALLNINWTERSAEVVKEYQSFIVNLLSAHNYHARYVIDRLTILFLPNPEQPAWPEEEPPESDIKKYKNIHVLINVLLAVIPMCRELLMLSISRHYPYYNKPIHTQECYLYNLLWILSYMPSFRRDIFHLIFSKLVIMDVNAPREEIEKQKYEDEDIFTMDDDIRSIKSVKTAFTEVSRSTLGLALDVCMNMMFHYFKRECYDQAGILNWDKTKALYNDMISVFDKVILPTYNTHHVQFVMFVICGYKASIAEAFLTYLWKNVCNPNIAVVLRQASVTYIASLLARGLFASVTMLKGSLQQMAEWLHTYMANQDGLECVNSDVRVHSVFYSTCQALFYVVTFRHKDLIDTKKNIVFLESLQLGKMVTHRLNPLRVCQPAVVQNFAAVTRKYQLAYCYTIMDHNTRNCMPTIYQDEKGSQLISENILNGYYPFDPYILERSSKNIQPLYRNYQEETVEKNIDVDTKEQTEIDDFLEGVHDLTPKSSYKFSYGSSPGFMFKN